MKSWQQISLLLLTIISAYFWYKTPILQPLSLQAFFVALVGYVILKRLKRKQARLWQLAPTAQNLEMVFITFAVLMLIVATGGIHSILFPILYVLLFFLVFTVDDITAIITSSGLSLFFYSLTDLSAQAALSALISLPVVTIFFLLAKKQYDIAVDESTKRLHSDDWNSQRSDSTGWFMIKFLKPTLVELKELSGAADKNEQLILQKLLRIESRLNQLIKEFVQTEKGLIQNEVEKTDMSEQELS